MAETTFRQRFLDSLRETGVSIAELSRRTGVSYDVLNKLKRGSIGSTSVENAEKIAAHFGWSGPTGAPVRVENGTDWPELGGLVPVYDVEASAGYGAVVGAEEHIYNLAFDPAFLRQMTDAKPRDLAIIQVKGDSMEPTLLHGDQVLVDRSKTNLDFDGLFVIRYGEALHVKRVGRAPSRGKVFIRSDNDQYPPFEVERPELDVVGRVLWYGRKV